MIDILIEYHEPGSGIIVGMTKRGRDWVRENYDGFWPLIGLPEDLEKRANGLLVMRYRPWWCSRAA